MPGPSQQATQVSIEFGPDSFRWVYRAHGWDGVAEPLVRSAPIVRLPSKRPLHLVDYEHHIERSADDIASLVDDPAVLEIRRYEHQVAGPDGERCCRRVHLPMP